MKCLFVRHPFAGWIVDGVKSIEYRTRPTKIRERIGIIQSRSGTVIGDVEITDCIYNEELDYYEWKLANARRYAKTVPFRGKNGAVVWIDVDLNPDEQASAPNLSAEAFKREYAAYQEQIEKFLHPKLRWFAIMKDGREIAFPDGTTDEELDAFEAEHKAEIDHWETEYAEE